MTVGVVMIAIRVSRYMLYKSISLEKQLLMKIGSCYYETNKQIISKTNIVDLVSKSTFKAHDHIFNRRFNPFSLE